MYYKEILDFLSDYKIREIPNGLTLIEYPDDITIAVSDIIYIMARAITSRIGVQYCYCYDSDDLDGFDVFVKRFNDVNQKACLVVLDVYSMKEEHKQMLYNVQETNSIVFAAASKRQMESITITEDGPVVRKYKGIPVPLYYTANILFNISKYSNNAIQIREVKNRYDKLKSSILLIEDIEDFMRSSIMLFDLI